MYLLRQLWAHNKYTVYQILKTLVVLAVFIFLKRALSRLIPDAVKAKLRSIIL